MSATSAQKATKTTAPVPPPSLPSADFPERPLITAEEYLDTCEELNNFIYELVQGRLFVRDTGGLPSHARVQEKLVERLNEWIEKFGRGELDVEAPALLIENPDTFRVADIAVSLKPFDAKNAFRGRMRGAPDIAIEVLSPSDRPQRLEEKTADYFEAGARRVWLADPKAHTVVIRKADGTSVLFEDKDTLEDPDILPGFAVEMQKIFGPPSPKNSL